MELVEAKGVILSEIEWPHHKSHCIRKMNIMTMNTSLQFCIRMSFKVLAFCHHCHQILTNNLLGIFNGLKTSMEIICHLPILKTCKKLMIKMMSNIGFSNLRNHKLFSHELKCR